MDGILLNVKEIEGTGMNAKNASLGWYSSAIGGDA